MGTGFDESSTMMPFIPSEIWKCHAVLLGVDAESSNTKISECLGVHLRTNSYSFWGKLNTLYMSWCYPCLQFIFSVAQSFVGFLLNHTPTHNYQMDYNLGSLATRCLRWCGCRNFLTTKIGFCSYVMAQSPVDRFRGFQQPSSWSRAALPLLETWC